MAAPARRTGVSTDRSRLNPLLPWISFKDPINYIKFQVRKKIIVFFYGAWVIFLVCMYRLNKVAKSADFTGSIPNFDTCSTVFILSPLPVKGNLRWSRLLKETSLSHLPKSSKITRRVESLHGI